MGSSPIAGASAAAAEPDAPPSPDVTCTIEFFCCLPPSPMWLHCLGVLQYLEALLEDLQDTALSREETEASVASTVAMVQRILDWALAYLQETSLSRDDVEGPAEDLLHRVGEELAKYESLSIPGDTVEGWLEDLVRLLQRMLGL